MASPVARAAMRVKRELHGVVVSSGLMQKTVKVRVGNITWNKTVKKHFSNPKHYLVHDPNLSLRTGDVISLVPGWRTSQHKRHVVKHIIAPYGSPIEERPPIPTIEDCIAEYEKKKALQAERRSARREIMMEQNSDARKRMGNATLDTNTKDKKEAKRVDKREEV